MGTSGRFITQSKKNYSAFQAKDLHEEFSAQLFSKNSNYCKSYQGKTERCDIILRSQVIWVLKSRPGKTGKIPFFIDLVGYQAQFMAEFKPPDRVFSGVTFGTSAGLCLWLWWAMSPLSISHKPSEL